VLLAPVKHIHFNEDKDICQPVCWRFS
jgi:hypothetical protein